MCVLQWWLSVHMYWTECKRWVRLGACEVLLQKGNKRWVLCLSVSQLFGNCEFLFITFCLDCDMDPGSCITQRNRWDLCVKLLFGPSKNIITKSIILILTHHSSHAAMENSGFLRPSYDWYLIGFLFHPSATQLFFLSLPSSPFFLSESLSLASPVISVQLTCQNLCSL